MHTSALKTCRIHHNGDYDGDIIITNNDSTSKPLFPIATVDGLDFKDVLRMYLTKRAINPKTVTFKGRGSVIKVSFEDVKSFVSCMLMDRCIAKLEDTTDMNKLLQIARILKVKTNPDILKERKCPHCVGRTGRVSSTCEDCGGSGIEKN